MDAAREPDMQEREERTVTGLGEGPNAYLRLLGRRRVFPDCSRVHQPRDDALREWAGVLLSMPSLVGRAFVFANNQFEGYSPSTIERLRAMV